MNSFSAGSRIGEKRRSSHLVVLITVWRRRSARTGGRGSAIQLLSEEERNKK